MNIHFSDFNESFLKVETDDWGIEQEISEFFSFFADGYKFTPKFRSGQWDGKIRLFDLRNKQLPKGLLKIAVRFCKDRGYTFSMDKSLQPKTGISVDVINAFIDSINIESNGNSITVRDYQREAIIQSISYYRNLLISPTASGKSAILYYKIRWHIAQGHNILLIVPTTQLVSQMVSDFMEYSVGNGFDVGEHCQMLFAGKDKEFTKQVMIQTWQSLAAMAKSQKNLFQLIVDRTDVVCMDEAHTFKSDVTSMVVNKLVNTKWRTGTTGTMQEAKVNKLQLIGMMSEPYDVITTKELMDQNSIVKLDIKMIVIKYPEYIRREMNGMDYKQEIDYLVTNQARNNMIAEIAKNCKGTTLILFNFVHKHGAVLYDILQKIVPSTRKVVFIHGGVDVNDREAVRLLADTEEDIIIIASSSIFSTGTNIPSIENVIFAMPTKSTIRVRQSIGRGLRLRNGKTKCTLFDVSDDLSYKSYTNTTLNHMLLRAEMYTKEQFDFKITNIPLIEIKSTVLTDMAIDDGPPW